MAGFDLDYFARLAPWRMGGLRFFEELESTNDEAARLGEAGGGHQMIVLAERQTRGRGRRGAVWLSEPGEGLMFSILLRPDYGRECWGRIALAAGWGIAKVLRDRLGIWAEVKWPNDVLIGGRKCCGILVEAMEDFVVLGIGLNVLGAPEGFACLADDYDGELSREDVFDFISDEVLAAVEACGDGFDEQLESLRGVCFLTGKRVSFLAGDSKYQGVVEGIGDDGSLLVRVQGETLSFAQASDIQVAD